MEHLWSQRQCCRGHGKCHVMNDGWWHQQKINSTRHNNQQQQSNTSEGIRWKSTNLVRQLQHCLPWRQNGWMMWYWWLCLEGTNLASTSICYHLRGAQNGLLTRQPIYGILDRENYESWKIRKKIPKQSNHCLQTFMMNNGDFPPTPTAFSSVCEIVLFMLSAWLVISYCMYIISK